MTIDENIMKECLAVLMVGGEEHAAMFQELRSWAVRNEARLHVAKGFSSSAEQAAEMAMEMHRWDALIEIFSSIAQEIQVEQMQRDVTLQHEQEEQKQ
jgi:hypothetical protein